VTTAKEQEAFLDDMECHYKTIKKLKFLTVGGIDFIEPLQFSFSNEYILLAVEYFSRLVEAIPAQNTNSKTVIKFLKGIFFACLVLLEF